LSEVRRKRKGIVSGNAREKEKRRSRKTQEIKENQSNTKGKGKIGTGPKVRSTPQNEVSKGKNKEILEKKPPSPTPWTESKQGKNASRGVGTARKLRTGTSQIGSFVMGGVKVGGKKVGGKRNGNL